MGMRIREFEALVDDMVTLIGEGNYTAVTDFDRQDNKTYAEIYAFELEENRKNIIQ